MIFKEIFNNTKFIFNYSKKSKGKIILFLLLEILFSLFVIFIPLISAKVIIYLTNNELKRMILVCFAILIASITQWLIGYFADRLCTKIYSDAIGEMKHNIFNEIFKIKKSCIEENGTGVFVERVNNDTVKAADLYEILCKFLAYVFRNIGILTAVFLVNKVIFVYLVIVTIINYVIQEKKTSSFNKNHIEYCNLREKASSFSGELIRGSNDIKMLDSEKSFLSAFDKKSDLMQRANYIRNMTNYDYTLISKLFSELSEFFMYVLFAYMILNGKLEIVYAIVLKNYSSQFKNIISSVSSSFIALKEFSISIDRIRDLLGNNVFPKESFGTTHLKKVNGRFEFKDVHFKYKENKVLKGINFVVNPNETVAFVGKSGAGKTTIFNLLCKMYDNYEGLITIDNHDIKDLDKTSIRGNITIISQNPYIFNLSIKENLKLVKKDLTNKEMIESCKAACLHDFIMSLPEGYDTVIGEGGVNLSGGQKQRLAIARALVQKTEIILFDEATSALDNETQASIQEAINKMKGTYTILIIAHRLSTIINSDRILFIDDGVIKAEGTHKELLKKCPEYKHLYESEISKNK